jgi:hypothetical protein
MSLAAQNPVSASLLAVLVIVSGAAIYSAVEVKRHNKSGDQPNTSATNAAQADSAKELHAEIARLKAHRADLLAPIGDLKDTLPARIARSEYETVPAELDRLRAKLVKAPGDTLTIHWAKWIAKKNGVVIASNSVDVPLRSHVKEVQVDTIDIPLINDNLGGDPAKHTHKVLNLSYSYGMNAPRYIQLEEYERLVLPEPPSDDHALIEKAKSLLTDEFKRRDLIRTAGSLDVLHDEAEDLRAAVAYLQSILSQKHKDLYEHLACPFSDLIFLDLDKSKWTFAHEELWNLQGRYRVHRSRVMKYRAGNFQSLVTKLDLPRQLSWNASLEGLAEHRDLLAQAAKLEMPALSETISAIDHT